mmetsp:Transcript_28712/g.80681  ORF Transcript_28712/g.80681 Transcript_28712/m.80681 type:complete len:321 (+) Transcript_28712:322-1284(+)
MSSRMSSKNSGQAFKSTSLMSQRLCSATTAMGAREEVGTTGAVATSSASSQGVSSQKSTSSRPSRLGAAADEGSAGAAAAAAAGFVGSSVVRGGPSSSDPDRDRCVDDPSWREGSAAPSASGGTRKSSNAVLPSSTSVACHEVATINPGGCGDEAPPTSMRFSGPARAEVEAFCRCAGARGGVFGEARTAVEADEGEDPASGASAAVICCAPSELEASSRAPPTSGVAPVAEGAVDDDAAGGAVGAAGICGATASLDDAVANAAETWPQASPFSSFLAGQGLVEGDAVASLSLLPIQDVEGATDEVSRNLSRPAAAKPVP